MSDSGGWKKLAAKAAVWTIGGYATQQVLRLGSNLILTRIFVPEVFGLMALVNAFLNGLVLFSDVGIRPSIVQNKRGDEPAFYNTAWTISVMRGVALGVAALILAWPFAQFYGEQQLVQLLPVAGLSATMMGFFSSKLFTMNRQLNMARLTIIDLATQVFQLLVTIALAFHWGTVWALVVGGLFGAGSKLVLTHVALPGARNKLHWDKEAARALFQFGRWVFISTLLTFVVGYADRLVFGKLVDLSLLGIYSMGLMLAQVPGTALAQLSNMVAFPLFSRVHQRGEKLNQTFSTTRRLIMLVAGWSVAGLIAGGPIIVDILYDARYLEAGWVVQILAAGVWFSVAEAVNSAALLALGQPKWAVYGRVAMIAGMAVTIPVGHAYLGFPGAVLGFASSELFRYAISMFAVRRNKLHGFTQDLMIGGWVALSAAAGEYAVRALGFQSLFLNAAIVLVLVSALWAPFGLPEVKRFMARRRAEKQGPAEPQPVSPPAGSHPTPKKGGRKHRRSNRRRRR